MSFYLNITPSPLHDPRFLKFYIFFKFKEGWFFGFEFYYRPPFMFILCDVKPYGKKLRVPTRRRVLYFERPEVVEDIMWTSTSRERRQTGHNFVSYIWKWGLDLILSHTTKFFLPSKICKFRWIDVNLYFQVHMTSLVFSVRFLRNIYLQLF